MSTSLPTPSRSLSQRAVSEIVEAAEQGTGTRDGFRRAFEVVCRNHQALCAELEVTRGAQRIHERYDAGSAAPEFWRATLESLLNETLSGRAAHARLYRGRNVDLQVALLATPIGLPAPHFAGAMVLVVPCESSEDAERQLDELHALCALINALIARVQTPATAGTSPSVDGAKAWRKVAGFESETEFAMTLVNRLCNREGLEQVSLGQVRGPRVRLLAVSGLDGITAKSSGTKAIRAAMEECLDLRSIVVEQEPERAGLRGGRLHAAWRASVDNASVASIPIFAGDELVAVLAIRAPRGSSLSHEQLEAMHDSIAPYVSAVDLVSRACRPLGTHLRQSAVSATREIVTTPAWPRRLLMLALLSLGLWCVFGSLPYRVPVTCSIVPTQVRHVGVPFEAVLAEVYVQPGDSVRAGSVLCSFDTTELVLERKRLTSELEIFDIQISRGLADGKPTDVELARAQAAEIGARLELIEHQIEASVLRARADGVVLQGDLEARVGEKLAKGDPLFELSVDTAWQLQVEVPADRISEVKEGQTGRFASLARPEDVEPFRIASIEPSAERRDNRSVFVAEAEIELHDDWLRAGVQGMGRIDAGHRSPLWLAVHRVADFARLHLWL